MLFDGVFCIFTGALERIVGLSGFPCRKRSEDMYVSLSPGDRGCTDWRNLTLGSHGVEKTNCHR
jgi:hypothetical protein